MKKQVLKIGPIERVFDKIDSIVNEYNRECEKSHYSDCETCGPKYLRRIRTVADNALKRKSKGV